MLEHRGEAYDDFIFDDMGNAWVATHQGNTVNLISPLGEQVILTGNVNSTEMRNRRIRLVGEHRCT